MMRAIGTALTVAGLLLLCAAIFFSAIISLAWAADALAWVGRTYGAAAIVGVIGVPGTVLLAVGGWILKTADARLD